MLVRSVDNNELKFLRLTKDVVVCTHCFGKTIDTYMYILNKRYTIKHLFNI